MEAVKTNIPNWWEANYLDYMIRGAWRKLRPNEGKLENELKNLATNVIRSKKYHIIYDYYNYHQTTYPPSEGYFWSLKNGDIPEIDQDYHLKTILCCTSIYEYVCGIKGKILVGSKYNQPLWADIPLIWRKNIVDDFNYDWSIENNYITILCNLLSLLTGKSPQQAFDRLLLPNPQKWSSIKNWNFNKITSFGKVIARHLGFPDGLINQDEYVQIISDAFLNQKYTLVDDRPILIGLEDHPLIYQVIIAKKGDDLVCRICTFDFGDILHIQNLQEVARHGLYGIFEYMLNNEANEKFPLENLNWSMEALIASIYRDLVTVEEKEIGTRRTSGKKKPDLKTKKLDPLEPKLFTTSWQYIPRRQYVYNRPNDESFMDREPLSEADQHKQRAIRKWHMVCGHIRRYRDKPDWMASGDKQDQALADGVILRTGETYVLPHARNAGALEELGEIDINSIPHYMRRKMVS